MAVTILKANPQFHAFSALDKSARRPNLYCGPGPRNFRGHPCDPMANHQQWSQDFSPIVTITEILTGRLPFLEKCDSILAVLAEITGSELVALRELDPENFTLNLVAIHNLLTGQDDDRIPLSMSAMFSIQANRIQSPLVVRANLTLACT